MNFKLTTKKALVLLLCLMTLSVQAGFKDGNKLLSQLTEQEETDRLNAIGYITGVVDVFLGVIICPPSNATAGQMVDLVKKELILNPAIRTEQANVIIGMTLANTWPCQKKGKSL